MRDYSGTQLENTPSVQAIELSCRVLLELTQMANQPLVAVDVSQETPRVVIALIGNFEQLDAVIREVAKQYPEKSILLATEARDRKNQGFKTARA